MNLIFDFDGTICDSITSSIMLINKILIIEGLEKTNLEEIRKFGLMGLIKTRKIPIVKLNKLLSKYHNKAESVYQTAKPIKGIKKVLEKLSSRNTLGVLTTNQKKVVETFLKKYKLEHFSFIYSESRIFSKDKGIKKILKEQKLDAKDTYYIGDETRDIKAAKKQKINAVAVTWGAESKLLLKKADPDIIINEPSGLLNL